MAKTAKEILKEAEENGISPDQLIAQVDAGARRFDGVKKSTFKEIKLDKDMYLEAAKRHLTLTQLLEEQDPSANYAGKYDLDAFERQLAVRGLQVSGPMAVALEEFYDDSNRVLFPEFINREIQLGRLTGKHTLRSTDLVATETTIDSGTYESAIADETSDVSMGKTPQGAPFPVINVTVAEKSIKLSKHALAIKGTYEARRRIKANKMAVILRLVGMRMERDMTDVAVGIVINGDGNTNPAFTHADTGLNYNNLVEFWAEFDPYESNLIVLPKAGLTGLLQLTEFKDPIIASPWLTKGEMITPLGHTIKRHDPSTAALLTSKMLGVDTNFTLEGITEAGSYITEQDKIIDGQWDIITISIVRGFAKIVAGAAGLWNYA